MESRFPVKPGMTLKNNPLAVYIHWPFCKSKCPYCDFNSHVSDKIEHDRWLKAYLTEIEYFKNLIPDRKVTSIFFGGGTPSLMDAENVSKIIEKVKSSWLSEPGIEVTLEANPTSIEAQKFRAFKDAGINRVSVGIQALNDTDLKMLGREHSAQEALKALETAGSVFNNFSFDLIYARPEQSVNDWKRELTKALSFAANHLSLYQLTIEKGTPFYSLFKNGDMRLPDEDIMAEMYKLTQELCNANQLPAYEVSNHAKLGFESQHNLSYWRYSEYLGIGPGAHGRLELHPPARNATMMIHHPENWLQSVTKFGHGLQSNELLLSQEMLEEFIMMGLRIKEGIPREKFTKIFGKQPEQILPKKQLKSLEEGGFLKLDQNRLTITEKGFPLLSAITGKLLAN